MTLILRTVFITNIIIIKYDLEDYLLTYSMEQSPSWEANWFAASQKIRRVLWNPKVHYRTHKRPPPVPILSQVPNLMSRWRLLRDASPRNPPPPEIRVGEYFTSGLFCLQGKHLACVS
jgi:hypothetical protein